MAYTTLFAVAHPWQCDQMGHMNVRFYASLFDDAGFQFLGHLAGADAPDHLGWADVRSEVDYRSATAAGTLLTVTTSVVKVGRSSVTYRHVMSDSLRGEVQAEAQLVTVRFDLQARKSVTIEDGARQRAEALLES
jgi:acyl-CoA thioester hydrolase